MASPLDPQYHCLIELKELEETIQRVGRDVERMPAEIQQHDDAIALKRKDLEQAKTQFAAAEKTLRAAERDLKEKEDFLFKAEGKMMEVKTNEAYQAAVRENQNQKTAKGSLEDKALQLLTALEDQKKALAGVEAEFKVHEQAILVERKKLSDIHEGLVAELETLLKSRKAKTATLDPAVSVLYNRAVNTGKVPVAIADKGRCLGCNVQVRAQVYNEVLGRTAIHRCTNCGRILIVAPRAPSPVEDLEASAK